MEHYHMVRDLVENMKKFGHRRVRFIIGFCLLGTIVAAQPSRRGPRERTAAIEPAPIKPEDKCSLEGQVYNGVTGEPLKRASVAVRAVDSRQSAFGATTDAGGQFSVKDLDPGTYRVSVDRTGFVRQDYGSRGNGRPGGTLTLERGQRLRDVVVRLAPQSVITGRITDEDGEPLMNVSVQALRNGYSQGRRQLAPAGSAQTNDLGEYRIHSLAPGKYYVSAIHRAYESRASSSSLEERFAPTFYPSSMDPAAAVRLDLPVGGQARGIDVRLLRAPAVSVKGKLANGAAGRGSRGQMVILMQRGNTVSASMSHQATHVLPDGSFEFHGVLAGSYTVSADVQLEEKRLSARTPVEVGASSIDGITLTLMPGSPVPGQVSIEGTAEVNLASLSIFLQARETMPGPPISARVKQDGTFAIQNVTSGIYGLLVTGLPAGYFVKSARLGDQEILESGLNLAGGATGGNLKIVLSPNGGQIDGVVSDAKKQPAPGATVTLVADARRINQASLSKSTTTDQSGRYSFQGIAPGDYTLYAWDDIEPGAYQDSDFIRDFEKSGESISIRESSHETRPLKQIVAAERAGQ